MDISRLDVRYSPGLVKMGWADSGEDAAILTPQQAREYAKLLSKAADMAEEGGGNLS